MLHCILIRKVLTASKMGLIGNIMRNFSQFRSQEIEVFSPQVFGTATYDGLFKYILSHDNVRSSFFHAFIPNLPIVSSKRLDDHMNPIQSLQLLRKFLHSKKAQSVVNSLTHASSFEVQHTGKSHSGATSFLYEIVNRFEEIKDAFPRVKYDGKMDFVCELDNDNGFALVEMQVLPDDSWDTRALAYVAAFYGNQLSKGAEWKDLRKVVGVNILGGGKDNSTHLNESSTEFFLRHYKFQDQMHSPAKYIDGIELIQYSLMNAPDKILNREQRDWITFFFAC